MRALRRRISSFFRRLKTGRRLRRNDSGAAAVEFAIIAVPFFFILFAIIEISLIFIKQQILETAVQDAARKIWTGEMTSGNTTRGQFKAFICGKTFSLLGCPDNLKIDVKAYDYWQPIDNPVKDGAIDDSKFDFATGGGDKIVVIRAATVHKPIAALFTYPGSRLKDGSLLIMASAAIRPEPYAGESVFSSPP